MNEAMNDEMIIGKLMNALRGDERYEVIESLDNSEIRGANAVSVGVDETAQANVGLPDYRSKISVYVSSHVSEDDTGQSFRDICQEVMRRLEKYTLQEAPLSSLFEEVPVVGFFFDRSKMMTVDDTYGKCYLAHLEYTVITSF